MPETRELTPQQTAWMDALAGAAGVAPLPMTEQGAQVGHEHEHEHEHINHYGDRSNGPPPNLKKFKRQFAKDNGMVKVKTWATFRKQLERDAVKALLRAQSTFDKIDRERRQRFDGDNERQIEFLLPILDAPSNNPERETIGSLLQEWHELDANPKEPLKLTREKTKLLNTMQKEIGQWLNRLTSQGLPLSAEALAMGDILQAEHQKLIREYAEHPNWGAPPVADEDQLTDEEKEKVADLWKDLVTDAGVIKILPNEPETPENETFRLQMLAGMTRLLGSASGRELVDRMQRARPLRTGGILDISLIKGRSPKTASDAAREDYATGADVRRPIRGKGTCDIDIKIPLNFLDSDTLLGTGDGNQLYSPVHVVLAHEILHALHGIEGMSRKHMKLTPGIKDRHLWTNPEELWTIGGGEFDGSGLGPGEELSEQTIRQDYGLSAERFGHANKDAEDSLLKAAANAADNLLRLAPDPEYVVRDLLRRDFPAKQLSQMPDWIKNDLSENYPATNGPIPAGWPTSQLTAAAIDAIIRDRLSFKDFENLGWSVCELPVASDRVLEPGGFKPTLKDVVEGQVHHPRSRTGRDYIAYGGKASIDAMAQYATELAVQSITWDQWNATSWTDNLRNLENVSIQLENILEQKTPNIAWNLRALALAALLSDRQRQQNTGQNTQTGR